MFNTHVCMQRHPTLFVKVFLLNSFHFSIKWHMYICCLLFLLHTLIQNYCSIASEELSTRQHLQEGLSRSLIWCLTVSQHAVFNFENPLTLNSLSLEIVSCEREKNPSVFKGKYTFSFRHPPKRHKKQFSTLESSVLNALSCLISWNLIQIGITGSEESKVLSTIRQFFH